MKALFIWNDRRIEEKGVHSALPVMYLVDCSPEYRTVEFRRHFITADGMVIYLENP